MRLDKFLKVSRIIKRRTVANDACSGGRVSLNGRTAKPGADVKIGDVMEIRFGNRIGKYRVLDVKGNRSQGRRGGSLRSAGGRRRRAGGARMMKAYAIILGGGSATRMGGGQNKVFLPIRGIPAIVRATVPFTGICAGAVVVAQAYETDMMEQLLKQFGLSRFVTAVVAGGATRQESVANGLQALPEDAEIVLIHDGARALVTEDVITRALASAQEHGSRRGLACRQRYDQAC